MGERIGVFAIVLLGLALGGCSDEKTLPERPPDRARDEDRDERLRMHIRLRRAAQMMRDIQRHRLEQIPPAAAACVRALSSRDPQADARTAYGAGERRLLSRTGDWVDRIPGVTECRPITDNNQPRGLPPLPNGPGPNTDYAKARDKNWRPCWEANFLYAKDFNLEMLRLFPKAVETSCLPIEKPAGPAPAAAKAPLQELLTSEDYPVSALRGGQEGIVRVRLSVGPEGRVGQCDVIKSSRSESLDSTTCRFLRSRGRFKPARNKAGEPIAATVYHSQRWRLPEGYSPPRPNRDVGRSRGVVVIIR